MTKRNKEKRNKTEKKEREQQTYRWEQTQTRTHRQTVAAVQTELDVRTAGWTPLLAITVSPIITHGWHWTPRQV